MNIELNAIQMIAIQALTDGKSRAEVIQKLGITENDLLAWQDSPTFIAELNTARREAHAARCERLRSMATKSLAVLERLLDSEDDKVSQSVALAVLRLANNLPPPNGPTKVEDVIAHRQQEEILKSLMKL